MCYSLDLRKKVISFIENGNIAKHTKVDMIWVAGRSPTLVSHSLRGVAMNLKATTLTYLAINCEKKYSIKCLSLYKFLS